MATRDLVWAAEVDTDNFAAFSIDLGRRLRAVPVDVDAKRVSVAMEDVTNFEAIDELQLAVGGRTLEPVAVEANVLTALLARWSRVAATIAEQSAVAQLTTAEPVLTVNPAVAADESEMARMLTQLLSSAVTRGASDVHFEPDEDGVTIRFRIDGELRAHTRWPAGVASPVSNQLKVRASLDTANRRTPLDGHFDLETVGAGHVDCRVVTLPTAAGAEALVVRLFPRDKARRSLADLGFSPAIVDRLRAVLAAPFGSILVTGPTGSGKTTTLYAAMEIVAAPTRKVLTVEDPVEVRIPGVTQVQVNEAASLTFASALRSFLRADPDVLVVGEVRDADTGRLAAQSAMTGHLVLATLHANTAAAAPARLLDLGVEPYMVASSLRAVLAQRLVRGLCTDCRVAYTPKGAELVDAGWEQATGSVPATLWRAAEGGCSLCENSGYRGRIVLGELIEVDDAFAEAIMRGASARDLASVAAAAGASTLHADGLRRAAVGDIAFDTLTAMGI